MQQDTAAPSHLPEYHLPEHMDPGVTAIDGKTNVLFVTCNNVHGFSFLEFICPSRKNGTIYRAVTTLWDISPFKKILLHMDTIRLLCFHTGCSYNLPEI